MKRLKSVAINFLLVFISIAITFGFCEFVYRRAIFGDNPQFQKYRIASFYSGDWDENYWKLIHTWGYTKFLKSYPHVGWVNKCWPTTFFHRDVRYIGKKRPVLLYGDSFAQCKDTLKYFEDILNGDTVFSKNYFFLNYGIGAYGVDQIYTLMKNSFIHYENPVVIFSFMTYDLDRSCLSIREGAKPYYTLNENNDLVLNEIENYANADDYLKKNPLTIRSYLWRRFLYSDLNFFSKNITEYLTGEKANREKIKKLNEKIILTAINTLRESKTDFMFLIFHPPGDFLIKEEDNWRIQFVKKILDENEVKYIWTKSLLKDKVTMDSSSIDPYFLKNDGHPNSRFNLIIAEEMKRRIFQNDYEKYDAQSKSEIPKSYLYSDKLDSVIFKLKADTSQYAAIREIAKKKDQSFDEALTGLAEWELWSLEKQ